MADLNERTKANMDVALEEACRSLPHGGDHALRKKVAERLLRSAQDGKTTLGELSRSHERRWPNSPSGKRPEHFTAS